MEAKIFDLGLVSYDQAWEFQTGVFSQVRSGLFPAAVIFCSHYPVITLGRSFRRENLRIPEAEAGRRGMKIIPAGRGGDITYHGPGQLVMYPVVDLQKLYKDVHLFLRCLEDVVIEILGTFNIRGERKEGFTGVWVGAKKICSIGIGVRNWVTFHGAAINVKKDDLGGFSFMRPCGLDIEMTSVEGETGLVFSVDEIKPSARSALSRIAAGKER